MGQTKSCSGKGGKEENSEAENQSCLQQEETDKEQLAPFHLVTPGLKLKTDGRVADMQGGAGHPNFLVQPPCSRLTTYAHVTAVPLHREGSNDISIPAWSWTKADLFPTENRAFEEL